MSAFNAASLRGLDGLYEIGLRPLKTTNEKILHTFRLGITVAEFSPVMQKRVLDAYGTDLARSPRDLDWRVVLFWSFGCSQETALNEAVGKILQIFNNNINSFLHFIHNDCRSSQEADAKV